jgi:uncharacterized protein YjbI with pentapeptide repeats
MSALKKPSEITLSDGRTLEVALTNHKDWLDCLGPSADGLDIPEGARQLCLLREVLADADLSHCMFRHATLIDCDFSGSLISHSDFTLTNLATSNLFHVFGKHAKFDAATLQGACLKEANFDTCTFDEADLRHAYLEGSNFVSCSFESAILTRASLKATVLTDSNLKFAVLHSVAARSSFFRCVDFSHADIADTDFTMSFFHDSDFILTSIADSDLRRTVFADTHLRKSRVLGCNMSSAIFYGSALINNDFTRSDVENAGFSLCSRDERQAIPNPADFQVMWAHADEFLVKVCDYLFDNKDLFDRERQLRNYRFGRLLIEGDILSDEGRRNIAKVRQFLQIYDAEVTERSGDLPFIPLSPGARMQFALTDFDHLAAYRAAIVATSEHSRPAPRKAVSSQR